MDADCILELRVIRPFGEKDTVVAANLGPEYRIMPSHSEVMAGPVPLVSFDTACDIMKQRQIGGEMIRDTASKLGRLIAERLEDEAGWHGEGRQERTRSIRK